MAATLQKILSVAPHANIALAKEISNCLHALAPSYGLLTEDEEFQFLAQAIHESNGLTAFEENLKYSRAERIAAVWPTRFSVSSAKDYVRNPAKLANKVYANRMGNGDESSGDGFRYRGRGMLQATGKSMYSSISKETGHDFIASPDDILLPKWNLVSSLAVAKILGLGNIHDFKSDTKRLNGGYTNYSDRLSIYNALKA